MLLLEQVLSRLTGARTIITLFLLPVGNAPDVYPCALYTFASHWFTTLANFAVWPVNAKLHSAFHVVPGAVHVVCHVKTVNLTGLHCY